MKLLAIDTARSGCHVAVLDSATDTILGSAGSEIGRGHAEQLMGFLDDALLAAGTKLSAIERIAVTVGPGSFTGIRVGVAMARGLSLALGIPAVGITTFEALAARAREVRPGRAVLVLNDARRDEIYSQAFDASGHPTGKAALLSPDETRARHAGFDGVLWGSGAVLLPDLGEILPEGTDEADIACVARLGVGARLDGRPKPLYIRGPDAKPQAGYAVARA